MDTRPGPNFIELLTHKKIAKHKKIMLTRIRLPAKVPCTYIIYEILLIFLRRKFYEILSAGPKIKAV